MRQGKIQNVRGGKMYCDGRRGRNERLRRKSGFRNKQQNMLVTKEENVLRIRGKCRERAA
jgi:hypothetical protein